MTWMRAGVGLVAVALVSVVLVSGGSGADPRTPRGLPGMPPPFLGIAVVGSGHGAAAIDAYGNVVELRRPGPAGWAAISVPAERQAAGTVPASQGLVARARIHGHSIPLWQADSVRQSYLADSNTLRTIARFGRQQTVIVRRLGGRTGERADRRWISQARPLGKRAPAWARSMYERSLLTLRALTDRRTGAVAAGIRDGWAYVWPRDAGAVALALAAAGYRAEAQRVVDFLLGLDLSAAARFDGNGDPVADRDAQGDASGWVAAASRAAGQAIVVPHEPWQERADYQEGDAGEYLANAIATGAGLAPFITERGLVREAGEPGSGLDAAAAWAVRPFPRPAFFPAARRTLLRLAAQSGRFGIVPSESWEGGDDPWTAPTAWTAWSLAALGERRAALDLIAALRRAATPLGMLPERVDADTGVPASTTPLAWSHAFAIVALRELWPPR